MDENREFNPLHPGVREHAIRVHLFFGSAMQSPDPQNRFRALVAAAYSCQAIVELLLDSAANGQMSKPRDEVKALLKSKLPHFELMERLRIHDFHRFGLVPPDPRFKVIRTQGPIKMTANQGSAVMTQDFNGPKSFVSGNSKIKGQRPPLLGRWRVLG